MTWRVEMGDAVPMVAEVLGAQVAWKKLTKPAQEAVLAAYRSGGRVEANSLTILTLERHGVVQLVGETMRSAALTDAGRRLAYWNARTP